MQPADSVLEDPESLPTGSPFTPRSVVLMVLTVAALALVINQLFNLRAFGVVLMDGRYLNVLATIFLAATFLIFDFRGHRFMRTSPLDWLLAALSLGAGAYIAATALDNLNEGWEFAAPQTAQWVAFLFAALVLEATRRAGGLVLAVIVTFVAFYPSFAGYVPAPFSGFQSTLSQTFAYHVYSSESIFGIPMKAFGGVVIGFIIFGAVLQHTGGGSFFNDLALGLVGRYRGGAAKVSIFGSGFMGSMSGSVISNVLTTGSVSIPAMKRTGFSAQTAAATEACASTGGVLMPPVMGATAFVMASFLAIPYAEVVMAAVIPSALFYFALFAQIDAYAARRGLRGLERAEVPRLRDTLRTGWPYVLVFGLLIFMMVVLRQETAAPFYSVALLLVINQISPKTRIGFRKFCDILLGIGSSLAELTAVILGVGLIVGSFSATGLAGTLVNELLFIAGDNVFVLLVMGAATAFIFGMGMTATACYIFLAIVLAPALEAGGLNQTAVHLFILYWGMVSYITPPVALGAYAAATIAETSPMRAGFESMRLGSIIYLVPFLFVLNPALIGSAPVIEVAIAVICAFIGVSMISMGLQGYVTFFGTLAGRGELPLRIMLTLGGFFIAMPAMPFAGVGFGVTAILGMALAALPILAARQRGHAVATVEAAE
ncbi:TRAP transporter fused permease subunit [Paracoccus sp. SCSIO 75233]|uniref:TRAP transporter permease n=1 Tax=Paracoccus sp. SCSIO 75233 TaxID=3017782 RepID=UPI0022F08DF3|nr:TRAP transporter fused permease subunit [Paracoccus sp. SCSIO 75233]WBU53610.1 TRAP transporter fused permease subunit [Paracoccus sp. SCSIO 75233]